MTQQLSNDVDVAESRGSIAVSLVFYVHVPTEQISTYDHARTCLTHVTAVAVHAGAAEAVDVVSAGASIRTWSALTFINFCDNTEHFCLALVASMIEFQRQYRQVSYGESNSTRSSPVHNLEVGLTSFTESSAVAARTAARSTVIMAVMCTQQ